MARMTHDATALQAVLGKGETHAIVDMAEKAFGSRTPVAVMRAQRAARVLADLGRAQITVDKGRVSSVSSTESASQHYQLSALMRKFVPTVGVDTEAEARDSAPQQPIQPSA